MKFDPAFPFALVYGRPGVRYSQGGLDFDIEGNEVKARKRTMRDVIIEGDLVSSAKEFLKTVLAKGPQPKFVIYRAAEENNQLWQAVKEAAEVLGLVKFKFRTREYWKLPESMEV